MEETVKILVVDDDEEDRMTVRRALIAAGVKMELSETDDCAGAIAALRQQLFDCVFLDYRLPDGDGLSLVQQVRALGITIPLIVLTGQGDEQIAVQLIKAGAYDYLSKSQLSPEKLSQVLRNAIRLHQAEVEIALTNQRLQESEERYRLVLEATNEGIWDWFCATDQFYCNDRLLEIIGVSRSEFRPSYATLIELMYPEDLPRIRAAVTAHLTHGEKCEVEFRMRHVSGEYRYCLAKGKAQRDNYGLPYRMTGSLSDITERKATDAEIFQLNLNLQRRIDELETLLDVIPIGIAIAQDPECQHIRINPPLAKLLNLPLQANPSKSAPVQPPYKVYQAGKELAAYDLPMQYAASNGIEVLDTELDIVVDAGKPVVKLLGSAVPLLDEYGKCRGSIGAFVDITERKRIEEQERFLAEASAILAASLDYKTTLESLAYQVVPQLADWCSIHIIDDDGSLREVTVAHLDPLKVRWAKDLGRRYPIDLQSSFGAPQVIRSGQSVLYPQVPDSLLVNIARDALHLESLLELGMKSVVCVPMQARGRTLGSITLIASESGRTYTPADLTLAEELGRRAGLAVDNGRLYRESNEIGENLRQAIIILGEQQQQLRVLQRITNLLSQRLTDLPNLLQVMVEAICDGIAEAEFAVIGIHNSQIDQLELTATAGISTEQLQQAQIISPNDGLIKEVFTTGEPKLVNRGMGGVESVLRASAMVRYQNPNPNHFSTPASVYAVPIASEGAGRVGVLAVGNWQDVAAFDGENQNLLAAVGEQAAIAINNARLISALEEREERLASQNCTLAQQNRELEQTRQRIEQQNLQLIEAARLKSQFLATMSHELRTPLNAIIGFAQVLLRQRSGTLASNQSNMVERILNNGKNLLTLINDILDLSKIEAGRLELLLEEINLTQLITTTVAELKPLADQKQLPLQVIAHLENPIVINDTTRLRQILVNLISNAIKFTETGFVEVKVSEGGAGLLISVKDTGIGIAASHLEHIFEEFRQVDQTTTRKHSGTGLGLAITQSLVNMMQGNIAVESKLGEGSIFYVQLPRRVVPTE